MTNELDLVEQGLDEFYELYGQDLARRVLNHSTNTPRFVFLDADDYKSVIEATKNTLDASGPVLIWEQYADTIEDGRRDNYNTRTEGSLAVILPAENSVSARRSATRQARSLCLQLLAHMRQDGLDGPLSNNAIRVVLDGQNGESTGMLIPGWVGYGYSFSWLVPLDMTVVGV
ncbi:hypothetical protein F5984_20510 [Rudanella paleaurantiibacter]|uniref:Uncharacterized protein n=1 Tax=Rudanella paleaurantiibacter TaxID=2614655 RepID=A0A7J5TVG0_9BACT|nr:hypothetical protein [Rudanella paleaurantiibacter]KAB7728131.1 hypothetical protein F5984_20510 [Rudanella paleaurantiibacter]